MRSLARLRGQFLGLGLLLLAAPGTAPVAAAVDSRGTPWLGVYSQELTTELREGLDFSGQGVLINRVVANSPADHAGLRKGDVIVRLDSRAIDSPDKLARVVRASRVGESIALEIVRSGHRQTFDVKLDARPGPGAELETPNLDQPRIEIHKRDSDRKDHGHDDWHRDDSGTDPDDAPNSGDREFRFEFPQDGMGMLQSLGRGRLGIRVESLNEDLGDYFGVKDGRGALVLEVLKDTPAERAGFKAGDVITRLDGTAVYDADDLIRAVQAKDGQVSITVFRQGSRRTLVAELDKTSPRAQRLRGGLGLLGRGGSEGRVGIRAFGNPQEREAMQREFEELRNELRELRKDIEDLKRN